MFRARSMRAGVLAVASLLTLTQSAYAQVDRGTITGQVTDQSGAIITGASVKAVHVATNFERTVTTSKEGSYTIPQLPVGGYVVIVTAAKFQTTTLENIEVTAGVRGNGVGARLLEAAQEEAKRQGKRTLWLHTSENNVKAHKLFDREGWVLERSDTWAIPA